MSEEYGELYLERRRGPIKVWGFEGGRVPETRCSVVVDVSVDPTLPRYGERMN